MPRLQTAGDPDPKSDSATIELAAPKEGETASATAASTDGCESICFGPFCLNGPSRLLEREGAPVAIGGRALDLLIALTSRPGEILSGRELLALVWPRVTVEEANLRVCIAALRKALGDGRGDARYIINVAGRGYMFAAPVRPRDASVVRPAVPFATPEQPSSLPAPALFMVGRNETVDTLALLLLSRRFITVVGPGGIGKTTVAIAAANALREKFAEDAAYFVDLGFQTNQDAVSQAVAAALRCDVHSVDAESSLVAFLANKKILIVLDNCEHLIEAVAPLAERLVRDAPGVHLLATSREALRVEGETVHLLSPLECPPVDVLSADAALAWPAVQLFIERAVASGHSSELVDADAPIVADICHRLDGIPLAIELAASRVGALGIGGVSELLDNYAEMLFQGRRSAMPRHQSMEAVLDWSFNLLSTHEQEIFCRLSTFAGRFELEAVDALLGADYSEPRALSRVIASLVDKSLISISSGQGRTYLRFLHTTRAYAGAKLLTMEETQHVTKWHVGSVINGIGVRAT
ncbi:helix-turn-helix transcriptional regulator (plasmid) [Aminobacter sp. NyZ550]|uniref:ATP-binding protein n=1 Tax=unclassified Aminobacter TaxID=2644704 RepID=UPI0021D5D611|nr:helix-turn-helix transcriptional regulator [Aminobacter sp. NyZ550]WAX98683.1 helix-turn-helix transcriptional regulator [Aminobacter sp. NyZ550]